MSSESEQLQWKAEGLPADSLFMENAVVIKHGIQVPLIIDPSTQAATWLKQNIKATVEITTQQVHCTSNACYSCVIESQIC